MSSRDVAAVRGVVAPGWVDPVGLPDQGVLDAAMSVGDDFRAVNIRRVAVAGEVAFRSQLSLGAEGMARRAGHARAALLVAELWKITTGEAYRLCEVGMAIRLRTAIDGSPLPARYAAVGDAVRGSTLGVESAAVIVKELDAASTRCSQAARDMAEQQLVDLAGGFTVADLRVLARQVRDRLDQDGAEPRGELRHSKRALQLFTRADGMMRLHWDMTPQTGGLVKAAIDAIVGRELRRGRDEHDGGTSTPETSSVCGEPQQGDDDRTLQQLRSDAAEQVFHHAATCKGAAGELPAITMVIRMTLDSLLTGLGIAEIDGVPETIPAATARQLAGEAQLIPSVLGGPSEVLDFGTARRLFSRAQKLAFGERDGGCAFGGCEAPPSYTEAHHVIWWSDKPNTDLDNGILLCGFHHHRIHDGGWEIQFHHGVPYFIPPPWVDPSRTPRQGGKLTLAINSNHAA